MPVEARGRTVIRPGRRGSRNGQGGIVRRDLRPIARAEPPGDGVHRGMLAPPGGVIVQLPVEITGVEPRQPRGFAPVPLPLQAVAGEAGRRGAAVAAAERDRLPRGPERAGRSRRLAAGDQQGGEKEEPHPGGTDPTERWFHKGNVRRKRLCSVWGE